MRLGAARAHRLPLRFDVAGDLEGAVLPAIGGLGVGDQLLIGQRAVALGGVLRRGAERDMRLAGDHRGARVGLGGLDRPVDRLGVVPVDRLHVPARGLEALGLIGDVGDRHLAVDGDAVVVEEHDELGELLHARKRDRLLAHALHEAAVTGHHPSVVIDDLGAVFRAQHLFGDGKAHRVGDALAERAGGGLDGVEILALGVTGGLGAPLAEVLDLFERHFLVAGQMQHRVEQHRAVAHRENEAVAVGPGRRLGVEFHMLVEQHGRDVGHAHRHAGVARIGGGNGVEGQGADGRGLPPVLGMLVAQGGDVHG